jgi:hypothetical protein
MFRAVAGFQASWKAAVFILVVGASPILAAVYCEWIQPWLYLRRQYREQRRGFEVLPPKF